MLIARTLRQVQHGYHRFSKADSLEPVPFLNAITQVNVQKRLRVSNNVGLTGIYDRCSNRYFACVPAYA